MAAFNKFNALTEDLAEKVHNLGSDTLKVMLTNTAPSAANAVKADIAEISAGNWRGPLHGIPLAHKDCFERARRAPTVGSRATDLPAPTQDAAALARLQHAGTVDLGP